MTEKKRKNRLTKEDGNERKKRENGRESRETGENKKKNQNKIIKEVK